MFLANTLRKAQPSSRQSASAAERNIRPCTKGAGKIRVTPVTELFQFHDCSHLRHRALISNSVVRQPADSTTANSLPTRSRGLARVSGSVHQLMILGLQSAAVR